MWHSIVQDVRYALRAFRQRPGFTAAALATLALGIGANTAIFSVVHAVLIRDLPYPEPDRLVQVYETHRRFNFDHGVVNPFNLDVWQRETRAFTHLAPMRSSSATLTGAGDAERVQAPLVAPEFFDVMGVAPAAGRVFTADEAAAGTRVAVLSHSAWATRFGADPSVVGRTVVFDEQPFEVIGIMPAEFAFPTNAEFWRPLHLTPTERANRGSWYLGVVGRLRPGATHAQAQQELDAISARLEQEFPAQRKDRGARMFDLHQDLTARVSDGLGLLQGVVVLVLIIACANLANLQIAQASGRVRELTVRAAMGAFRARLARQLLTESLLLSLIGGTLATMVAVAGVPALVSMAPPQLLPAFADIGVSGTALAFTIALSTVCGLLFGVIPALLFSRPNLIEGLRQDGPTSTGSGNRTQRWFRSGLIAAEVTLAFTLLFGSALLVRSFVTLSDQDTGFRTEKLLTASVTLPARYATADARSAFWQPLLDRLASTPGVTGVAASTALPFSNWEWQTDFEIEGLRDLKHDGSGIRSVSIGYFDQLGIPLRQGRAFDQNDAAGAERVVMINDAFARAFFGTQSPIGHRLRTDRRSDEWSTIVGVAGNTRHVRLSDDPGPEIYRPLPQNPASMLTLALRTTGAPDAAIPALRDIVRDLDAYVPLQSVGSMDALVGRTMAERRFHMWLLSAFAALAAVLTLVGIYGVTSYLVGLRTREMGIRLALGATPQAVGRLVVGQGLRPVLVGLTAGVAMSLFAARLVESQLFGVTASDPATMVAAGSGFLVVSVIACLAPARRSARVSPVEVLRG